MSDPRFIRDDLDSCVSHVIEECGELLAALGKSQRFGFLSVNPLLVPDEQEVNANWVLREIADVRSAVDRLEYAMGWMCAFERAALEAAVHNSGRRTDRSKPRRLAAIRAFLQRSKSRFI
ncbi:hypothetical protein [Sphingomonas bacterium]|uniref:hypothetical protein n=1 Tax=Sphingomonas bacterium TaxID=1895847 RepID=UPI001577084C|nr:hypothetical protein [Sphingomonas bacterium]